VRGSQFVFRFGSGFGVRVLSSAWAVAASRWRVLRPARARSV